MSMVDSFEKIPLKIFNTLNEGSFLIASEIAKLIRVKEAKNENAFLDWLRDLPPRL